MSLDKIKPHEVSYALSLPQPAARAYLEYCHPEVNQEESDRIVSMAKSTLVTPPTTQPKYERNKFITAAWLCGASHRQLALLYGITQQVIFKHIDKVLGHKSKEERQQLRLVGKSNLDITRLAMYHTFFNYLSETQPQLVNVIDPVTLALMLHKMPDAPDYDPADPYLALEGPPERLVTNEPPAEPTPKPAVGFSADNFLKAMNEAAE